jgi:hypothetical protein
MKVVIIMFFPSCTSYLLLFLKIIIIIIYFLQDNFLCLTSYEIYIYICTLIQAQELQLELLNETALSS